MIDFTTVIGSKEGKQNRKSQSLGRWTVEKRGVRVWPGTMRLVRILGA